VALLSVFRGACVGCTCESGCHPVRLADFAAWAWWRCAADGGQGEAGGGLSSSVICAFYIYVRGLYYTVSP
jgi:hypothetical protein